MAKRSNRSIVVSMGCPLPPYTKEQGRRRPALGGARQGSRIPTPTTWKGGGGILLPVGVGLLLGRAIERAGPPPPPLLYIRGGGHPLKTQQLIIDLLAVCGAPSTIVHLDNIVAVLRRSPGSVEHHHRHHPIVRTELSLKARRERSSRDVIELNVC